VPRPAKFAEKPLFGSKNRQKLGLKNLALVHERQQITRIAAAFINHG
jgi:hypothetical protein